MNKNWKLFLAIAMGLGCQGIFILPPSILNGQLPKSRISKNVCQCKGKKCHSTRPYLIAHFNSPHRAILEAIHHDSQTVNLNDLGFTSQFGLKAAAFHGLGTEGNEENDQEIKMSLKNVHFCHMESENSGVGVFIGSSVGLEVDERCIFDNLIMSSHNPKRYAGGAAIVVIYLEKHSKLSIRGTFVDNSATYPQASRHSSGGAIYLDYMEGTGEINGNFKRNSANQGGAIHIQDILGNFLIKGTYTENIAKNEGEGARGGVVRILAIRSTAKCTLEGIYRNNKAFGRGGVLATNVHNRGGILTIHGTYQNNIATDIGGVWGFWSENTSMKGTVVIRGHSVFQGNGAFRKPET
eukprot:Awhi_evm1s14974